MLINLRDAFLCCSIVANRFINYLQGAGNRYREDSVGALLTSSLPGM